MNLSFQPPEEDDPRDDDQRERAASPPAPAGQAEGAWPTTTNIIAAWEVIERSVANIPEGLEGYLDDFSEAMDAARVVFKALEARTYPPPVVQQAPVQPACGYEACDCRSYCKAQPAAQSAVTDEQMAVLNFLWGAGTLDGYGFGDTNPNERGRYWWRKWLHAAFPQVAAAHQASLATQADQPLEGK